MKHITCLIVLFFGAVPCNDVGAFDWLTAQSTYTHDPNSGTRVHQYAPVEPPTTAIAADFRTSGYTHTRSTLQYGQSADNYHRVQEWGDPVRPYEEWRFPYRPYSTPYPNWGPPFGGFNAGVNFNHFGPGIGYPPGTGMPGQPAQMPGQPAHPFNPASGYHGVPHGFHQGFGYPNPAAGTDIQAPYPAGQGTPYPVAPYYDGYYPNYRD